MASIMRGMNPINAPEKTSWIKALLRNPHSITLDAGAD